MRVDEKFKEVPGSEFDIKADLVLLAMGFLRPVQDGMIKDLGVELDQRGNVEANTVNYRTSVDKIFAAGDMRRGQSLVVWAIREGRQAARAIDEFLMGEANCRDRLAYLRHPGNPSNLPDALPGPGISPMVKSYGGRHLPAACRRWRASPAKSFSALRTASDLQGAGE